MASDPTSFLTAMAALSTATQTLVDHIFKRRFTWLDKETPDDPKNESRRFSAIHLLSFFVGGGLCYSMTLDPLAYLSVDRGHLVNAIAAGVLVSFGGSFFNEILGAVREFKKTQADVREAVKQQGVAAARLAGASIPIPPPVPPPNR